MLNIHNLRKRSHFGKKTPIFENTASAVPMRQSFQIWTWVFTHMMLHMIYLCKCLHFSCTACFAWTHSVNNDCIYFDCVMRVSKMVELQGGSNSGTASFSSRHCPPLAGFENSPSENSAYIWGRQFPEFFEYWNTLVFFRLCGMSVALWLGLL